MSPPRGDCFIIRGVQKSTRPTGAVALIGPQVAEVALRRPVPALEAVSELGERCREAVVRGVVGGEFVVSAS